ncbi:THO complex subunit 1 transcription elongation factor-domain-containing protein [Mycena alexandri]|uniref:THO complex subunit 1 transcription elongation factor-domain-containing protein n=1 Tax=Mycena alexandri TaxID=1745969 RepID=A0AAD6T6G1_9AGAR|nr:THO complex subunit 1 transcription elongation factor-domain-containing protein [Mycena alexandri]
MASLQPILTRLLKSLPPSPTQEKLNELVKKTLVETEAKSSAENRKSQWEFLLKNAVFDLACTEGKALKDEHTNYYNELRDILDVVLTFTEHEACEQTLPFTVLQDLLETQTIASCSHIFSWIEARAERLTDGLVPQKGKALILLRTLNDLLRRLSKMGSTTIFCGRILTFLSGVFPLGERSGVNLRGEYGPTWEGVKAPAPEPEEDVVMPDAKEEEKEGVDKMQVDDDAKKPVPAPEDKKSDFYNTFWSLQLPFSKPPLFALPNTFDEFKDAVTKVIPVIREATAKERAMMGSRVGGSVSLKRKRELDPEESGPVTEYFFAKFLTSPDLLDLEIADTHFRRQFLFQLAILLTHLQTFTKASKAIWASARNRSLQMDFTLEPAQAEWVQETYTKVMDELKQTAPNGRAFAETVSAILEREKNWVKWKNELCTAFDKEPWSAEVDGKQVGLEEATREVRRKMREPSAEWMWRLGTEPLTSIWDNGYRAPEDLQIPFRQNIHWLVFRVGNAKDFYKRIQKEDALIALRKNKLRKVAADAEARSAAATAAKVKDEDATMELVSAPEENATSRPAAPAPASNPAGSPIHPSLPAKPGSPTSAEPVPTAPPAAPAPPPAKPVAVPSTDDEIRQREENKDRWAWLAFRMARDQHLEHFGKIGTGDVELLVKEIEAEKKRKEQQGAGTAEEIGSASPVAGASKVLVAGSDTDAGKSEEKPEDGDVQMDVILPVQLLGPRISDPPAENPCDWRRRLHRYHFLFGFPSVETDWCLAGSHVIYTLQNTRRYKVISLDNGHNSHPLALSRVSALSRSELPEGASARDIETTEIESHACDLTRRDEIRAVFEKYGKGGIWGVVHIAAYKAVGESVEIPLTYYENNVTATLFLLQTMQEFDCTRIVYSSSATVYGIPPTIPIPETTRLKADSPYGKTKVMSETMLDDLCHADPKWSAIALRYFNPAGAHPSGQIGEDPKGRPGNLLPLLAHMAVGRVDASTLTVFGNDYPTPDGTCVRDYLHVLDLAKGHLLALEALNPNSKVFESTPDARYKAYNLGQGKGVSVLEIIAAMRKATGFDFKYEIIGHRRGDVPDLTADPALAQKELGFKANEDLAVMCRDLWNFQSKNPEGYGKQE